MVIPITTVSAQPVVKACRGIPIVFAGVTDPIGAGLVSSLTSPGDNVTGTSDLWPFAEQFSMMRRVLPRAKTIAYLYNPGESQAQFALDKVREAARNVKFQLIERQVDTPAVVRKAALEAAISADLFYFGMDNTVGQAFDSLLKVCLETKKPLFAGDSESVRKGALLCLGIDHKELGIMTGKVAEQILFEHKKPGDIPIWQIKSGTLYYNSLMFQQFNMKIPEFVLEQGKDLARK
jgi:putative ABC transport system substrate-binding protein